MQKRSLIMPIGQSAVRSIPLPEGRRIEVEFDSDGATIEIRHVEPCDAISGLVFVGSNEVGHLVSALLAAVGKSGGLTR